MQVVSLGGASRVEDVHHEVLDVVGGERTLYRPTGSGPTVVPLDLRAGVIGGAWTPRAARPAVFAVSSMPITAAEQRFVEVGCRTPPGSNLERLNLEVSDSWEKHRVEVEVGFRETLDVPTEAVIVAVSLDDGMVPMRDGDRAGKHARAVMMCRAGPP